MKIQLVATLACISVILASAQSQVRKEPHTPQAVITADLNWTAAEEKGDVTFVDALLLPEYRSVSADGSTHDKEAILASTRKATPARAAMIQKYIADHPTVMAVALNGDTAVLTFTSTTDPKKLVRSCDVFVYRDGRWLALYSQHSDAEKA